MVPFFFGFLTSSVAINYCYILFYSIHIFSSQNLEEVYLFWCIPHNTYNDRNNSNHYAICRCVIVFIREIVKTKDIVRTVSSLSLCFLFTYRIMNNFHDYNPDVPAISFFFLLKFVKSVRE